MSNFDGYNSEKRLKGQVAVGGKGVLIGRISFFDEGYTEGSILCVIEGQNIDSAALLLCPPLAVIAVCAGRGEGIGGLCCLGVPCIVMDGDVELNKNCKNKIALVDTERGILTLEPSIETLNFYSAEKSKGALYNLACPVGYVLNSLEERIKRLEFEHFLVSSEALCADVGFFENAVAIWEAGCPELLVIDMQVPGEGEGDARLFSERIEDLFCASLYGSFALALSGFFCEEDLSLAIKLLHKAFCLLEAEGREFNGYIPRGIIFSSPLWLTRASPVTNPDFIIFDLDLLLPTLFSLDSEQIIKKEKLLKKELFFAFERYLESFAPRCEVYVKTKNFFGTRLLSELTKRINVKLVFR